MPLYPTYAQAPLAPVLSLLEDDARHPRAGLAPEAAIATAKAGRYLEQLLDSRVPTEQELWTLGYLQMRSDPIHLLPLWPRAQEILVSALGGASEGGRLLNRAWEVYCVHPVWHVSGRGNDMLRCEAQAYVLTFEVKGLVGRQLTCFPGATAFPSHTGSESTSEVRLGRLIAANEPAGDRADLGLVMLSASRNRARNAVSGVLTRADSVGEPQRYGLMLAEVAEAVPVENWEQERVQVDVPRLLPTWSTEQCEALARLLAERLTGWFLANRLESRCVAAQITRVVAT